MSKAIEDMIKEVELEGRVFAHTSVLLDKGYSEEDIIRTITRQYNVTKDYAVRMLHPGKSV